MQKKMQNTELRVNLLSFLLYNILLHILNTFLSDFCRTLVLF